MPEAKLPDPIAAEASHKVDFMMSSAAPSSGGLPQQCVDFLPPDTTEPSEEDLTTAFLQCMAQMITDHQEVEGELMTRNSDAIRDLMVLFSAALVFFMQGK